MSLTQTVAFDSLINYEICWVSVDPVNRKIDYYPKTIAAKIEKAFYEKNRWELTSCALGADCFNATVWFHPRGFCYQTTPACNMGRYGFKQPGYRSVKRIMVPVDKNIELNIGKVRGEWRIVDRAYDNMLLKETIPESAIINTNTEYNFAADLTVWKPEDLDDDGAKDKSVIVWEWRKDLLNTISSIGDDATWAPYLYDQVVDLERAFKEDGVDETRLLIPFDNTWRTIKFIKVNHIDLSCFAEQIRCDEDGKEIGMRQVRRHITTVGQLNAKFGRIKMRSVIANAIINRKTYPDHMICCISQSIMLDPVKTIDGHTYDRAQIERWFEGHMTSPLTGLQLSSKDLVPNAELYSEIMLMLGGDKDKDQNHNVESLGDAVNIITI